VAVDGQRVVDRRPDHGRGVLAAPADHRRAVVELGAGGDHPGAGHPGVVDPADQQERPGRPGVGDHGCSTLRSVPSARSAASARDLSPLLPGTVRIRTPASTGLASSSPANTAA
jgi:hypothetical protein